MCAHELSLTFASPDISCVQAGGSGVVTATHSFACNLDPVVGDIDVGSVDGLAVRTNCLAKLTL